MAINRKQQLIHLHGSIKANVSSSDIKQGEIIVLHPESGATQFGTLNNAGNEIVWFNDYKSTKAYVDGLNSAMDTRVKALESLTGTTNSALQSIGKGTDGDYVTTTVSEKADNKQNVSVAVKTQKVSEANATGDTKAMGLAEASDVKTYVDGVKTVLDGEIAAVSTTANAALKTVTGENAIVADTGNAQNVKVTLKTSGKGNVKLTNDADGLSATVDLTTAETVTGVSTDDKVLSLSDKLISATVSLDYYTIPEGQTNAGKKVIRLIGKDNTVISTVDATDFIKDGMLEKAELISKDNKTYIKFTFNTDGGSTPIELDVTSLIDVYTAKNDGGLVLDDHAFSVDTAKIATVESVNKVKEIIDAYTINGEKISANPVLNATQIKVSSDSGSSTVADAIKTASEAGVQSFGGQKGVIAVKTAAEVDENGTVQFTIGEKDKVLTAVVKGIDSAAYKKAEDFDVKGAAAAVLGSSEDSADKYTVYGVKKALSEKNVSAEGQTGNTALVTASANSNKVTVGVTEKLTKAVTSAESALQTATVKNTSTNKITATKTATNVEFDFDSMIIDCGTF